MENCRKLSQISIKYSWLSLSRTRLSLITAYLKVKIMSLPKHENLTSKTYCGKEEKLLLRSNFACFPQYFRYISNFKSPITLLYPRHTKYVGVYSFLFVKCGCLNYFFLNPENLICRGTDISKCFRESLGIRDNESRLYSSLTNTLKVLLSLGKLGFWKAVAFQKLWQTVLINCLLAYCDM